MNVSLDNEVALVTGGSRGIGAATVKLFVASGAKVVFSYRKAARAAREVVQSCNAKGKVIAWRADVSKRDDVKALVEATRRHFGRVDILVANAGIWPVNPLPIERITEREWDKVMAVNLKGVYAVASEVVPDMIRRQSGRIIVVSSAAAQRGKEFRTHYAASKGGLISLVKGLATELAPQRILVNCVAPGYVDTDLAAPLKSNRRESRKIISTIPVGRLARPEEVAMPILFLASEMASYITGEIVNVNGGTVLCS